MPKTPSTFCVNEPPGQKEKGYDAWFRRKVNIGLRQMADVKAVSCEEANARLQAFKAACKSGTPAENPL